MSEMSDNNCTLQFIRAAEDRCLFVTNNCEPGSLINFYNLYYCSMSESYFFVPIGVSGFTNNNAIVVPTLPMFLCTWINS